LPLYFHRYNAMILHFLRFVLTLGLAYQYFLLVAGSYYSRRRHLPATNKPLRFAVLIPAHNEEDVIAATVGALRQLAYPSEYCDIHVVADHCNDGTAQAAMSAGALVHVRADGPRGRKGFALDWLIQRVLDDERCYDAVAVFDADSLVDPDFLNVAASLLATGASVVQGQHVISNPESSMFSRLADVDMRLNNLLRNQSKATLQLSARLMGDGMVFRRSVLNEHPWMGAHSLAEDRDYGLYLVTQGVRIQYAHAARSYGQAAPRWEDATPQRLRWYGGAFELQKRYLTPLLHKTLIGRSLDALDKLLELLLPPFTFLVSGSLGIWCWTLARRKHGAQQSIATDTLRLALAAVFPMIALAGARAPVRCYRALLAGPLYVAWRIFLVMRARLGYRHVTWVRTKRSGA
jgi:cellulose synthase/poly-beta-1,6-N-acetylglucosamine synthase-like glycosyltransferase